ncbi:hypothetical protein SDC9_130376 [bioreactor metagenome]|uniref:Uncharacterized protein n=1 Tax=bioreactor metagenome TaxID=1076179 RepID=A0A645D3L2_9ZZZZ
MVAPGGQQGSLGYKAVALLIDSFNEHIKGEAVIFLRDFGCTSEITDRLEVHAAHRGRPVCGKTQNVADVVRVDAGHQHGHQRDPDVMFVADFNGPLFDVKKRAAPQRLIDVIPCAVKLHEDKGEPRGGKYLHISLVLRKPDAVCVELDIADAGHMRRRHNFRQVVPQCRLSARELHKTAAL